jgi:tetratricopeptide (TPR) repeat protein
MSTAHDNMETRHGDFDEGKRLQSLGFYGQAVAIFSRIAESHTTRLEVIFRLSETLLLQGYYSRALEIIDKALCGVKDAEDTFLPATRMLRCCVAAIVTAKIKTCLNEAERIYNGLSKENALEVPDHCRVRYLCTSDRL